MFLKMRYRKRRHEVERSNSPIFVFCFISVFLCAVALGTIRLYGLHLEHRISDTTSKIATCRERHLNLSKEYSKLLSPANVYSFARENLGMESASSIVIISVAENNLRSSRYTSAPISESAGKSGLNPFVKRAHAKD